MSSTSTRLGEAAGPGLPNSLEDHSIPMRQFPSKKQRLNNKLDKGFDVRLEKKKIQEEIILSVCKKQNSTLLSPEPGSIFLQNLCYLYLFCFAFKRHPHENKM